MTLRTFVNIYAYRHPGRRIRVALASTVLLTLLAGCATLFPTPEEAVKERAEKRWAALIQGKFETAYTYGTPAFRAAVPQESYRGRFGNAASWQSAEVIGTACGPDKCDVKVKIRLRVNMRNPMTIDTEVSETWLLENAQWWYYQKP